MTTRSEWTVTLLHELTERTGTNYPVAEQNLIGIVAWQVAEDSTAQWNPLDTERNEPTDADYNPQGVKDYPSEAEGLKGTIDTLTNGLYGPVLLTLQRGNSAHNLAQAVGASEWGSGDFSTDVVDVENDTTHYFTQLVPGSAPEPQPSPEPTPPIPSERNTVPPTIVPKAPPYPQSWPSDPVVVSAQLLLNGHWNAELVVDGRAGQLTGDAITHMEQAKSITAGNPAGQRILGPKGWRVLIGY